MIPERGAAPAAPGSWEWRQLLGHVLVLVSRVVVEESETPEAWKWPSRKKHGLLSKTRARVQVVKNSKDRMTTHNETIMNVGRCCGGARMKDSTCTQLAFIHGFHGHDSSPPETCFVDTVDVRVSG